MPFQSGKHTAQQIDVAANHRPAFDETLHQQARIALRLAPEAGTRRNKANDPAVALDNDGAQIAELLSADGFPKRRSGLGQDEAALHDVLRLPDEE